MRDPGASEKHRYISHDEHQHHHKGRPPKGREKPSLNLFRDVECGFALVVIMQHTCIVDHKPRRDVTDEKILPIVLGGRECEGVLHDWNQRLHHLERLNRRRHAQHDVERY